LTPARELVEDGKTYREWLIPADVVNPYATVEVVPPDEDPYA